MFLKTSALILFPAAALAAPAQSAENIAAADLTFDAAFDTADEALTAAPQLTGDPNQVLQQVEQNYRQATLASLPSSNGCTAQTITIRKEWNNLSPQEQQNFFDAMNCMNRLPGRTSQSSVPGARTRYDDWTAAHIISTPQVHFSPWLLLWHRHFIWLFEKAMQEECGYVGGLPYGDWLKYGDMSSGGLFPAIGGDGTQRQGSGCSCVESGPFANWQVNLGPTGTGNECSPNPREDGLGLNTRCLERKFDRSRLADLTPEQVASTIVDSPDIDTYQPKLDVGPSLHANPHSLVGGLQGGIPASSHDPWFMTHHPCLDRHYAMWVAQDMRNRTGRIAQPSTYASLRRQGWGDAPTVTLDSVLSISPVFESITARDAISTTDGPYCYMYE